MFISKIFFETQSGGIYIVLVAHGISILFRKFNGNILLSKRKSEHFPHFSIHNITLSLFEMQISLHTLWCIVQNIVSLQPFSKREVP